MLLITTIFSLCSLAYAAKQVCTTNGTVAPPQHMLTNVRTAFLNLSGFQMPFGITYAQQKNAAFVSYTRGSLLVLNTTIFIPTIIQDLPLRPIDELGPAEVTLSPNGDFLYAAGAGGAVIVNTARAIGNESNAVVGYLNGNVGNQHPGYDKIGVAASEDYVFVTQEHELTTPENGNVDVFRLNPPLKPGNVTGNAVGFISLGIAVTVVTLSPDGKTLYAVSEIASQNYTGYQNQPNGTISILDVATLEKDPKKALLGTVTAECGTTRAIVSQNGQILWVANRGSNTVTAFNTTKMLSDPQHSQLTSVGVGTAPDGLVLVENETRLLVLNTNRFYDINSTDYKPCATAGVSVIDVEAALRQDAGANLGQIPSGLFPRDVALSPDGSTVLVSNFNSRQVQAIDLSTLP